MNVVIWGWTRLFVLPFHCIYDAIIMKSPEMNTTLPKPGFVYLLSCMVMLHAYWFFLFFKLFARYSKTGEAEDC